MYLLYFDLFNLYGIDVKLECKISIFNVVYFINKDTKAI